MTLTDHLARAIQQVIQIVVVDLRPDLLWSAMCSQHVLLPEHILPSHFTELKTSVNVDNDHIWSQFENTNIKSVALQCMGTQIPGHNSMHKTVTVGWLLGKQTKLIGPWPWLASPNRFYLTIWKLHQYSNPSRWFSLLFHIHMYISTFFPLFRRSWMSTNRQSRSAPTQAFFNRIAQSTLQEYGQKTHFWDLNFFEDSPCLSTTCINIIIST